MLATPVYDQQRAKAVVAFVALAINRVADRGSALCHWDNAYTKTANTFGRQALPMVWDFSEVNPFGDSSGDAAQAIDWIASVIHAEQNCGDTAVVTRGSATALPWPDGSLDAVITDPPYYDNVPYADISDFFYVWLKRSIGHHYPEHFAAPGTPKKQEAVADATRHGGDRQKAVRAYEEMMAQSLAEAHRVLKPGGVLAVVYAHKTTLGWATLVDAFRRAGFTITEAWPLDTEMKSRLRGMDSAALASSIFLVGRKREGSTGGSPVPASSHAGQRPASVGSYEDQVQPELEQIVRERVETLWDQGITGADLVIACVGAGLRAFTKYERVEYANGEEVPAEKFLAEVEGVVLDTMMGKLFGQSGAAVSAIDPASRFYVLWRFVYKTAEIEAGEAIVFTYAQHVELDGPNGLSTGKDALVEKKKAKYRARDYTERGANDKLGLPHALADVRADARAGARADARADARAGARALADASGYDRVGQPAPLIDVLHRVLWLMEHSPRKLREFLSEASPDRERLRILAQALAGAALSGKSETDAERLVGTTPAERAALGKLLANWRSVIEDAVVSEGERADRKAGQKRMFDQ